MKSPEVSIVITNYNYGRFLETSVRSCIAQRTSVPFEVLIVDDGSTDDSRDVVRPMLAEHVRLIARANGGIEAASNAGIEEARGEFVVRVDADDYLLPDFISEMVPRLRASDSAFAYPDYIVVDSEGAMLYAEALPDFDMDEVTSRGDFLATGTLYRKSALDAAGRYSEATRNCGLENFELVLKLLASGRRGVHVPGQLFAYRRHGGNVSVTRRDAIVAYGRRLFAELALGSYRTNQFHPYRLELTP